MPLSVADTSLPPPQETRERMDMVKNVPRNRKHPRNEDHSVTTLKANVAKNVKFTSAADNAGYDATTVI